MILRPQELHWLVGCMISLCSGGHVRLCISSECSPRVAAFTAAAAASLAVDLEEPLMKLPTAVAMAHSRVPRWSSEP